MATKAQQFARKRNYAGGTIAGIVTNLKHNVSPVATDPERMMIQNAIGLLEIVAKKWNDNYENAKQEHV